MICGTLDQVFSSVSNGLILFALAVVAGVDEFGRISLMFTLLAAAVGLLRGALGTTLLLSAGREDRVIREHGGHAVAAALLAGAVMGVIVLVFGLSSGITTETYTLALAVPVVLMQDVLRYVAITVNSPHLAALWDGLWCAASVVLLMLTWTSPGWLTTEWLVGGWCAMALIALLGLMFHLRVRPRFTGLGAWLRDGGRDRLRYGVDAGLEQVTVFIVLVLVASWVDPEAVAAVRGATAVLAPLAIVMTAVPLLVIPESARSGRHPVQTWRLLVKVAVGLSAIAAIAGVILRVLPDGIGRMLLGDSFAPTREIIVVMSVQYALSAWVVVLGIHLKVANRSAEALAMKVFLVVTTLIAVIVGIVAGHSSMAVAVSFTIATAVVAVVAAIWLQPWREPPSANHDGKHRRPEHASWDGSTGSSSDITHV